MSGHGPRITLRIDRIVAHRSGLDRAALEKALRQEVKRTLSAGGVEALGQGGYRPRVRATLPEGKGAPAARVASAAIGAVRK